MLLNKRSVLGSACCYLFSFLSKENKSKNKLCVLRGSAVGRVVVDWIKSGYHDLKTDDEVPQAKRLAPAPTMIIDAVCHPVALPAVGRAGWTGLPGRRRQTLYGLRLQTISDQRHPITAGVRFHRSMTGIPNTP